MLCHVSKPPYGKHGKRSLIASLERTGNGEVDNVVMSIASQDDVVGRLDPMPTIVDNIVLVCESILVVTLSGKEDDGLSQGRSDDRCLYYIKTMEIGFMDLIKITSSNLLHTCY